MTEPSIRCPHCNAVSYNPNDIRERYCGNCHRFHGMPKLLSDKIEEFFAWLEEMTDYGDWHPNVKIEVQKKLIEIITQR